MNKYQLVYFGYIEPIIEKVVYVKHFIQARLRWINLKLFPPKNCRDYRLNMDYFMLETLSKEKRVNYMKDLQKIRDITCRNNCKTH